MDDSTPTPPNSAQSLNYGKSVRVLGRHFTKPTLTKDAGDLARSIFHDIHGRWAEDRGIRGTYAEFREAAGSHVGARKLLRDSTLLDWRGERDQFAYAEILGAVKKVQYERGRYQATIGSKPYLTGVPDGIPPRNEGGEQREHARELYMSFCSGKLEVMNKPLDLKGLLRMLRTSLGLQFGNLRVLKLINNNLESLSGEVFRLASRLECFEVSQNKLCSIPEEIKQLKRLNRIVLDFNGVTAICDGICSVETLESLRMSGNSLSELPDSLGNLQGLVELKLGSNHLVELPRAFVKLNGLQTLHLSHNKLKTLALFSEVEESIVKEDWKECVHPVTGEIYYEHKLTKERRRFLDGFECGRRDSKIHHDCAELPRGWEVLGDDHTSNKLYYNATTGESTKWKPKSENDLRLDLSAVSPTNYKLQKANELKSREQLLRSKGLSQWTYTLNDETGCMEYTNEITGELFQSMPSALDLFGRLRSLVVLSLSCNQLTNLPPSIGMCRCLKRLDLDCNQIAILPKTICNLAKLERLVANDNKIASLPEAFGDLSSLQVVNLDGNRIGRLPDTMHELSCLKVLSLNRNRLLTLPARLGDLTGTLDTINAFENPLKHPPQSTVAKGTTAILWECRERALREKRGPPPRTIIRTDVGVMNERRMANHAYRAYIKGALEKAEQTRTLQLHFLGLKRLSLDVINVPLLQELYVTGQSIEELPACLNRLHHLRVLSITGCGLAYAEPGLWDVDSKTAFTSMNSIDLSQNKLRHLPKGITNLAWLTQLKLSGNAISILPEDIARVKRLKHLRAENNLLESLPLGLFSLPALQTLFLSKNRIKELPDRIGQLKRLERLHIGQNQIAQLPSSIKSLANLQTLQAAHNKLRKMPEDFASESLGESLILLNVSANQIRQLPTGFAKLKRMQTCMFDVNPIRSPPPQRNGASWKMHELIAYHQERETRMEMVSFFEREKGYKVVQQCLYPQVVDAIDERQGILTSKDKKLMDKQLDQFLNSDFYNYDWTIDKLDATFECLYARRKQEHFSEVLNRMLEGIELAVKEKLVSPRFFSKDCLMPFGRDFEEIPCYALRLGALLEPFEEYGETALTLQNTATALSVKRGERNASTLSFRSLASSASSDGSDTDSEEEKPETIEDLGLLEAVQVKVPGYNFPYSIDVVRSALKEYRGPYGRSVWFPAPFRFEGESEETFMMPEEHFRRKYEKLVKEAMAKAKADASNEKPLKAFRRMLSRSKKQMDLNSEQLLVLRKQSYSFPDMDRAREVVIISQLLYTQEEKSRRAREEVETASIVNQRLDDLRTWFSTTSGAKELSTVSENRIAMQRELLEVAHRESKDALTQRDITQKTYELHKDPSRANPTEEDDERFAEYKKAEAALKEAVEEVETEKRYRRKRYGWCEENTRLLAELYLKQELEKQLLEITRRLAFQQRLRRPWDGEGFGTDFHVWKVEWQRGHLESSAEFGEVKSLSLLEQGAMINVRFSKILQDVEETKFAEADALLQKGGVR